MYINWYIYNLLKMLNIDTSMDTSISKLPDHTIVCVRVDISCIL